MRQIVCHECQKRYNFDEDDFCPRCGAFTPPAKQWDVDSYGNVVRVDGINEKNHAGSFVHREVHKEKAVRRAKGMDRDRISPSRKAANEVKRFSDVPKSLGLNDAKPQNMKTFLGIAFAVLWALISLILEMFG